MKLNGESFFHNILRYLSWKLITKILYKTNITPNQITIFRTILVVISYFLFLKFDNMYYLYGFFLFQFAELLDSIDGDLARYKNLQSKMGIWLEIFFDAILTPVWGVLGLLFAYIAYQIDHNYIYFIIWGLIGFSNNLEKSFLIHFGNKKKAFESARHGHIYFGIIGEPFGIQVRNFIIISKMWENQWLIFSGLLYMLFDINLFIYVWIWLLLLSQIHWIRIAYKGYMDAKE